MPTLTPKQFGEYIQKIPRRDQVPMAETPIQHFEYDSAHAQQIVAYLTRIGRKTAVYPKGFNRHLKAVSSLAFFQMVAAFERFLKDVAAVCVDELAPLCSDDRLSDFKIAGEDAAPHVLDQTIGRALCETQLWHNLKSINDRYRKILSTEPNTSPALPPFNLFDDPHSTLRKETLTLKVMFQIRHTIAHNLGTLTRSDAGKLQRLLGERVDSPKELDIESKHVLYLRQFLSPLAKEINLAVADRLGKVLTQFQNTFPSLIDHVARSKALSNLFQVSFTIAGHTENP